ncbi:sugar ABC transporter ATP-binding protein [Glycomyces sp. TRM65418]|uniref:sugar ABC transporter ATP-binding protein n=1 Tax=Glycomyces sp. TRM65418 TaxID=2867006 RepID=UPI001CE5248E|nr:sugar ABC transporter ATP-binding protein [Glycomyces sp. TRM65418]MCC3762887.1 sugar ABC transporter ATP-binding protein [Glycomyces sp. TRM65418]QZD56912.1 sugar ABC transporter ATP-binding protein [Glycomyces sp. TRM65418]
MTATAALTMRGIDKAFHGIPVLSSVDLTVEQGEVHALVGENGAGKSTLMKILAGVHTADAGTIELGGRAVSFTHPVQAQNAGIATVFQEFNLLPELSVAENVHLGREPRRGGRIDRRAMADRTAQVLADLGVEDLAPTAKVGSLSVAHQQITEIAKALSQGADLICMDEPTAALADAEVALLYRLVERLRERGVSVLYVSHRLREIFDLCDRITILKDGRLVDSVDTADITPDELVTKMVGRRIEAQFPERLPGTETGDVRLRITAGGNDYVDGIDLDVHAGEIVGLAGLQGSGRTEIAEAVFGITPFTRGSIAVDGRPVRITRPRKAIASGIALVTEDRKAQGLALHQSVRANARMVLDANRSVHSRQRLARIRGILSSLDLVSRGDDQEVQFLSGGNQQKVVVAKWLAAEPGVIVLDEPTRGIDVGAKHKLYSVIRSLAADGLAVLLIASELIEVIGLADRIVVLHDGRIAGELPSGATEQDVMAYATGRRTA